MAVLCIRYMMGLAKVHHVRQCRSTKVLIFILAAMVLRSERVLIVRPVSHYKPTAIAEHLLSQQCCLDAPHGFSRGDSWFVDNNLRDMEASEELHHLPMRYVRVRPTLR